MNSKSLRENTWKLHLDSWKQEHDTIVGVQSRDHSASRETQIKKHKVSKDIQQRPGKVKSSSFVPILCVTLHAHWAHWSPKSCFTATAKSSLYTIRAYRQDVDYLINICDV